MKVRLDRAGVDDGPAIVQLLSASALPLDGAMDCLDTAVVARFDGRVVGCAALELYPQGALLRSVAVSGECRSHGIGQSLIRSAVDLARRNDMPAVYLLTTTAEHFFQRLGFSRVGRDDVPAAVRASVEFQSACPSSAIAMRRDLGPLSAPGRRRHPSRP